MSRTTFTNRLTFYSKEKSQRDNHRFHSAGSSDPRKFKSKYLELYHKYGVDQIPKLQSYGQHSLEQGMQRSKNFIFQHSSQISTASSPSHKLSIPQTVKLYKRIFNRLMKHNSINKQAKIIEQIIQSQQQKQLRIRFWKFIKEKWNEFPEKGAYTISTSHEESCRSSIIILPQHANKIYQIQGLTIPQSIHIKNSPPKTSSTLKKKLIPTNAIYRRKQVDIHEVSSTKKSDVLKTIHPPSHMTLSRIKNSPMNINTPAQRILNQVQPLSPTNRSPNYSSAGINHSSQPGINMQHQQQQQQQQHYPQQETSYFGLSIQSTSNANSSQTPSRTILQKKNTTQNDKNFNQEPQLSQNKHQLGYLQSADYRLSQLAEQQSKKKHQKYNQTPSSLTKLLRKKAKQQWNHTYSHNQMYPVASGVFTQEELVTLLRRMKVDQDRIHSIAIRGRGSTTPVQNRATTKSQFKDNSNANSTLSTIPLSFIPPQHQTQYEG